MEQEIFRFIAVRSARPLAQSRWLLVHTSRPDAVVRESAGEIHGVALVLEELSRWLGSSENRRSPDEIARWVARALRLDEQRARQALRALVASGDYRTARDAVALRVAAPAEGVADEPAVRVLLVCGLLERLATDGGARRLTSAQDVAAWLVAALVVDDGPPSPEPEPEREGDGEREAAKGDIERFARPGRLPVPEPAPISLDPAAWRPWMALARAPALGELVVVERELCGYEKGEVADIENVMAGERKEHNDRDFELSELEEVEEAERTVSRSQANESRDETRMRTEAEQTLASDTRFQASLNVVAQYPPYVTMTADAGFELNSSQTQTDRSISELAREVTSKTAKLVTDRELTRRTTRTRRERERRYRHRFEGGDDNLVGVYRFVDAVWTARSVRYSPPRLQCELVLPEPAAWLRKVLQARPPVTIDLPEPKEPANGGGKPLSAADINRANWAQLAAVNRALGVPAPPDQKVTVGRTIKSGRGPTDKWEVDEARFETSDNLNVPEGYKATNFKAVLSGIFGDMGLGAASMRFAVTVGDSDAKVQVAVPPGLLDTSVSGPLAGITDVVPVAVEQMSGLGFVGVVTITCELTDESYDRWRSTAHARIWAAYQAAREQYESRLAEARSQAGDPPAGLRSTEARRLIESELRRLCLHMLAGGRFPRSTGVEPVAGEFLTPDLLVNAQERDRILFLEQAFDWGLIQYLPYPYYWGRQSEWNQLALRDGPDAMLAEFERAGAARVVVPAREKFSLAVLRYLKTGKVWFGGRPPQMGDPLYVSIAMEVAEQLDRPRKGVVLDTWRFRLPTPHLVLDDLPECPPLPEATA